MKLGFLVAGLVVGLFAVLMLYNFISVAIENKKNEIGILRAVGASGGDVFKIFITEALIITSICFVLSSILSVIACSVINTIAVASIVKISFLNFRFINVLFLLLTSIIIAFVGTFLPVLKASKCSPVESIKAIN
jgi:ABC-type lipoprotein release transport system permease subunit